MTIEPEKKQAIDDLLARYKHDPGNLITVLQETQEILGYLSIVTMREIAGCMNIPSTHVYGVATFYTQFRFQPIGKHHILLCEGTACHVNGAKLIETALVDELKLEMGQTSEDKLFTLSSAACVGCCSLAPVIMINGQAYGPLTPDSARKVVSNIRKQENTATTGGDAHDN
jgi:NADH-quinone oxidoreductase subunit E